MIYTILAPEMEPEGDVQMDTLHGAVTRMDSAAAGAFVHGLEDEYR